MTIADTNLGNSYNDIIRSRLYFGAANPATASEITTEEFRVFNKGQGTVIKNISTQADVTLKTCDTSLFNDNGIIPNAQKFTVMAIGIDIHLANVQANVPFEDDTIPEFDLNPAQVVNPYPIVDWMRSQGTFSLYRNSTEFLEQGNFADYPCGLYNSGWGSDGSADGQADADPVNGFVLAQNGMAFRELTVWHELVSLDQFHGRVQFSRPALLTGTGIVGYVDFLLVGQADVSRSTPAMIQSFTN